MYYSLSVYKNNYKREKVDLLANFQRFFRNQRLYAQIDGTLFFQRVEEIHKLVLYILLDTNYSFEIKPIPKEYLNFST